MTVLPSPPAGSGISRPGGLDVRGGAGGLAVRLDSIIDQGAALSLAASRLADLTGEVAQTLASPGMLAASVLAPGEGARVAGRGAALLGWGGLTGLVAECESLAQASIAAVVLYRRGEAMVETMVAGAGFGLGLGVGVGLGAALAGAAPIAVPVVAAGAEPGSASNPWAEGAHSRAADWVGRVDRWVGEHPWVVQHVADGLEGVTLGLGVGAPPLGLWLGWRATSRGAWRDRGSGRPVGWGVGTGSGSGSGSSSRVAASGAQLDLGDRSQRSVLEVILAASDGILLDEDGRSAVVTSGQAHTATPPRGVADLVAGAAAAPPGRVRISRIVDPHGGEVWVVAIPGTADFSPRAGTEPFDLTSAVHLMAGRDTLTSAAIAEALADAQRRLGGPGSPAAPILLTGHSQGGLTAAALAADPRLRARFPGVGHVVTTGAPIARTGIPTEIQVLSIEHTQDLVPGLDGADNPDRATWVTVRAEVEGRPGIDRSSAAHHRREYALTAAQVDDIDHPSVHAWRTGAAHFVGGSDMEVIDYAVVRGE